MGQRIGISAIPGSPVELMALNEQVERQVLALAPCNRRVADATLGMLPAVWAGQWRRAGCSSWCSSSCACAAA